MSNYPIFDSAFEIRSFTLPYTSSETEYTLDKPLLRSWKQLPFSLFKFENSRVDNLASVFYNIRNEFVYKESENNNFSSFYDNVVTVFSKEFGDLVGKNIEVKILLQIDFEGFNLHNLLFEKDWHSEPFYFECQLEIGNVIFTDLNISIGGFIYALRLAKDELGLEDYQAKYEVREVPAGYKQTHTYTEYSFETMIY